MLNKKDELTKNYVQFTSCYFILLVVLCLRTIQCTMLYSLKRFP